MPLSGLNIVFTGRMSRSRDQMTEEAENLGAFVQKKVTHRTDFLVTGKNVGKVKTKDAQDQGCRVITEGEYSDEVRRREMAQGQQSDDTAKPDPQRETFKNPDWLKKLKTERGVQF